MQTDRVPAVGSMGLLCPEPNPREQTVPKNEARSAVTGKLRHLDLFSGIGGFALAARWTGGIETIGFSEINPDASKILARHWPDIPNYGDIRKINGVRADIITGGFPCQPFSGLGDRNGKDDDRYLWPEMLRVISASGAQWVVAENVPRIVNVALDDVLDDLERAGYSAWAANIPACAVSAPHLRARIWVVGHLAGGGVERVVGKGEGEARTHEGGGRPQNRRPDDADAAMPDDGWPAWNGGPRVCRVGDGLSRRIHGLGNAIVPQVAFQILNRIVQIEAAQAGRVGSAERRADMQAASIHGGASGHNEKLNYGEPKAPATKDGASSH